MLVDADSFTWILAVRESFSHENKSYFEFARKVFP